MNTSRTVMASNRVVCILATALLIGAYTPASTLPGSEGSPVGRRVNSQVDLRLRVILDDINSLLLFPKHFCVMRVI